MDKPSPARNIASSLDFGPLSQGLAAFGGWLVPTTSPKPPRVICVNTQGMAPQNG